MMTKNRFLSATALQTAAIVAVALSSMPVMAQDDPVEQEEARDAVSAEGDSVILVTGSRIGRVTPFNSPDPVTIVDPEVATREGKFDLASTLQSSPVAAGSTQITAAISSNFVTAGGPGAQTIDLRGLGPNRTLVLLNGRRAGPAGTRGGVSSFDLNVLPQSLAENVQILKTGASSVYGSDAIAGVVNIITKNDMDGLHLNANVSRPFDSGGEEYRVNAIWGKTFSRGSFLIGGDYTKVNELARGDRDYLACPEAYIFAENGTRADIIDPRTGQFMCEDLRWGHVWTYNLIGNMRLDGPGGPNTGVNTSNPTSLASRSTVLMQYQYPGETLGIPAFGAPAFEGDFGAPAGWFPTGYDRASLAVQNAYHPFVEEQTMIPETDLYTGYAQGRYEILDSVELFGEFLFNRRKTYQNGWRQFWNFGWTGDLYGTGGSTDYNVWGDGWTGVNFISPTAITNQSDNSQRVDYYRGVGGLRGDLGGAGNWRWEVYSQYSRSNGIYRSQQILQDAYDSGYFQYSSCAGTTLPFSGRQCIDIPWTDPNFLRGELTPEQIGFLFDWEQGKTVYTQLTGEATMTGELFQLPAGPLSVAFGANVRRDRINDLPGHITYGKNPYYDPTIDVGSLTPAQFNSVCRQLNRDRIDRRYPCDEYHSNAWGASSSGNTAGSSITKEAFAEINVPIFADRPWFRDLSVSAAGRVTNVKATRASDGVSDSDNGNFTYKLGVNWAVNDLLRFRASYGTSFRAPALFEQFLADETSFPRQTDVDPCVNWGTAQAQGNISQRIATNCAAAGVPSNHNGAGVSPTVTARGGLGDLEAETSRAYVIGAILTPRLAMLPDTSINIAVDYFDIRVKGEISQLGARAIIFGCYDSENFPNDPLCSLFTRGQTAAPNNIAEVRDQFVNIASQRNTGVDAAVSVRHNIGDLGLISFTADMTWQIKDDFQLLPTSPISSTNGEAGSPSWVGDFRVSWNMGSRTLFYGINVIGGTDDREDFLDRNGGSLCINSITRGRYCPILETQPTFYHNASFTQELMDGRFAVTLGVSNIFDTRPPRVSVLNGGQIQTLGPVVVASQYPFVGRRGFMNVSAKF